MSLDCHTRKEWFTIVQGAGTYTFKSDFKCMELDLASLKQMIEKLQSAADAFEDREIECSFCGSTVRFSQIFPTENFAYFCIKCPEYLAKKRDEAFKEK